MMVFLPEINIVKASGTICIRSDGSVYPDTTPIATLDNITYYFTNNIYDEIVVQRNNIVVDGAGYILQGTGGSGTGIYLSGISNVTIKNIEIVSFTTGIILSSSSNNYISANYIINDAGSGIQLYFAAHNVISGNNITNNSLGIELLEDSSHNVISGNTITNHKYGVLLFSSSNNTLTGNVMNNNEKNFGVAGDEPNDFMHSIDVSNLINGKPVYYLLNQKNLVINPATYPEIGYLAVVNSTNVVVEGLTLTSNGQGLLLANVNNSRITDNNFRKNRHGFLLSSSSNNILTGNNITNNGGCGIWLDYSSNCIISGNNITRNNSGIGFWYSSNNTMSGNNITTNSDDGVYLWYSSCNSISVNNIKNNENGIWIGHSSNYNSIYGNNIENNDYGVWLESSSPYPNNKFCHNNFINNAPQVHMVSSGYANFWDDGYPSGGNYWDDYAGLDQSSGPYQNETGSDGIGDTSHNVATNNQDGFPLMGPFNSFSAGTWDETPYYVHTVSNSIVSDFAFSEDDKLVSFNVTGPDATLGFCRVSIPNGLLWCDTLEEWNVTINGNPPTYLKAIENTDYTYLYFTYDHSIQEVQTKGIHVIPEFPTWASMLLIPIVLTVAIAIYKRRILKTPIH